MDVAKVACVFHLAIFLGPVFFRTSLQCSSGYYLQRGGMFHVAVVVNCKTDKLSGKKTGELS